MQKAKKRTLVMGTLIILVGLLIIYVISNFSVFIVPGSNPPCVSREGLWCAGGGSMNTKGQVSFLIQQFTNKTMYNVSIACVVGNSLVPSCVMAELCQYNSSFIPKNYTFSTVAFGDNDTFVSKNSPVFIKNLSCYDTDGLPIGNQSIGKKYYFNIYVWLKYTNSNIINSYIVPGAFQLNLSVT